MDEASKSGLATEQRARIQIDARLATRLSAGASADASEGDGPAMSIFDLDDITLVPLRRLGEAGPTLNDVRRTIAARCE